MAIGIKTGESENHTKEMCSEAPRKLVNKKAIQGQPASQYTAREC